MRMRVLVRVMVLLIVMLRVMQLTIFIMIVHLMVIGKSLWCASLVIGSVSVGYTTLEMCITASSFGSYSTA